jgi:peptidyl-prolyl cis-trans isomerase SurA
MWPPGSRAPWMALVFSTIWTGSNALPASAREGGKAEQVIERIVAVVNSDILLLSELEDRVAPFKGQLQQVADPTLRAQRLEQLRREMLDQMVDDQLIKQEANKLKLTVSDKDLELAIKDVMRKNNLTREQLEAALKQEGKGIESYKSSILKPQLLRLRVLNSQVRSRITVNDEELQALYQKNLRTLGAETKVRARHIFLAVPEGASVKEVASKRRQAEALLAKVKAGEDFAELAKKHSEDSVTRIDGGDLGFLGHGTLPAHIEEAVFAMKVNEVRGVIRTDRGFHLLQVLERKESSARTFDEVKEDLMQQIYAERMEKATTAYLTEVRKRSHIDTRL